MAYMIEETTAGQFSVYNVNGCAVAGPYKLESSAKRRMREIVKAEQAIADARETLDKPVQPVATVAAPIPHGVGAGAWSGNGGPRGVYPAISKFRHIRRAYG